MSSRVSTLIAFGLSGFKNGSQKTLMDDLAASDPALAAKLMAGAPNQASHKMRK